MILLGFATLMFGMETMTGAVAGLKDVPEFRNILLMFSNPVLGVLAGAALTAVIQSSSASVGILQALSATGQVTYGAALPIIMGQNIGTCVTALLSSVGTNKNAKRAAVVHLLFNIIGTVVCLAIYCILNGIFHFAIVDTAINQVGIAVVHTSFNILCTALLLPLSGYLESYPAPSCGTGMSTKQPRCWMNGSFLLRPSPSSAVGAWHLPWPGNPPRP